ncbi:MAG: hypothetical protein LBQ66_11925 [Planctomycetaceae bacterium]|nr:hypothetical protein [Planctomycetaceae bacterium]
MVKFPFSGGIVHIADTDSTQKNGWIVLYRSFYGGERDRGRQGTILLTAWIQANEIFEGLLSIFNNETFKFVEQHSKELPVPAPATLTEKRGGNLPEKWQKGLEKFAPYITPRFNSHLKITDNPTGLNYEESSAFVKDKTAWEAEHIDKETALEGQVNALSANLDDTYQTLSAVRSDLDRKRNELNRYRESINGTVFLWSSISIGVFFIVMFIISFASPNWSVDIIENINLFKSVEQQITEVDEKLKNFDKKKTELEAKKKKLEDEKLKKEQEKQKKEQEKQKNEGT